MKARGKRHLATRTFEMNVYEVPGNLIFGTLRRSINDLLRLSDVSHVTLGPMHQFSFVIIAQGLVELNGSIHVIGILPVKVEGAELMITITHKRKNAERECVDSAMLQYLIQRANAEKMDRIYYTSMQANSALEQILVQLGFEYIGCNAEYTELEYKIDKK